MLRFKGRSILLAMLLAFVVSVTGLGAAFAATSDPYMTSYELGSSGYRYLYNNLSFDGGLIDVQYLEVGPSSDGVTPSYFDTQADAAAVEWSFIDDGSVYVVQIEAAPFNDGTGWLSRAEVYIQDVVTPTQFGSVSIQALNPNAIDPNSGEKAYVNLTLQINEDSPATYTSAGNVRYVLYDPADPRGVASADIYATTNANDYYEDDNRSYPTGTDGVYEMWENRLIDDYELIYCSADTG